MASIKECDVVSIRRFEGDGNLKAFIDIRVGGALIIRGCTVFDGKNGRFVSMPRRLGKDGRWTDVVVTSDDDIKTHYEKEILKAYDDSADSN